MSILVFEIGGSSMRAGLYDPAGGELAAQAHAETPNNHRLPGLDGDQILATLAGRLGELAETLLDGRRAEVVAIGYPGPVSPAGIALSSPTILGQALDRPVGVAALVRSALGVSDVLVINDVTACGYRHVAEGLTDFCLVNVGSGIGNKLFVDGRALVGPQGRGGEIGHFTMDLRPDAPICECGGRGHLAGISSGRGTERFVRAAAGSDEAGFAASRLARRAVRADAITTADIVAAFHDGDPFTTEAVRAAARPLAHALAGLHAAVGVERFILAGGFATALGEGYRATLATLCREAVWDLGQDWSEMLVLGRGGDADGLIGLGWAATHRAW